MLLSYKNFTCKDDFLKRYINIILEDLKLNNVKPLTIQIESRNLYDLNHFGYCSNYRDNYQEFKLVLNSECNRDSFIERVANIAHELRHVYQRVNDKYEGRISAPVVDHNSSVEQWNQYYNHSSEVDARNYEKLICDAYHKADKIRRKK